MSLWIFASLAAAAFQTARFMLQKVLAASALSAAGATFARFLYSAPLVSAILAGYLWHSGQTLPPLTWQFWMFGAVGGVSQIVATVCVVLLFKERNFAVGISFKNTEVIQSVLVGLFVLGDGISWLGLVLILVGVWGVLLLSDPPGSGTGIRTRLFNKAAGLGLASGFLFAISGVFYRGASLELAVDQPLLQAGITLAAVTAMQMAGMALWLRAREPGEITRVWAARRTASFVGLFSMAGSYGWFLAFTLQTAAYVKAVGQIELILSLVASTLFFRETINRREIIGMAVLTASIVGLVLVAGT